MAPSLLWKEGMVAASLSLKKKLLPPQPRRRGQLIGGDSCRALFVQVQIVSGQAVELKNRNIHVAPKRKLYLSVDVKYQLYGALNLGEESSLPLITWSSTNTCLYLRYLRPTTPTDYLVIAYILSRVNLFWAVFLIFNW